MTIKHGTSAGYTAHFQDPLEADQSPCDACREARHKQYKAREKRLYLEGLKGLRVSSVGTHRRIRALQRMGWTANEIGRRINPSYPCPKANVWQILNRPMVHVDLARRVDRIYQELSHLPGPSSITKAAAIKKGWAPPMAWDDIDSPNETPKGVLSA